MNKTTVIIGGVIILMAIIGGLIYSNYSSTDDSLNATSTPTANTGNGDSTNTTRQAGLPIVITKSNSFPTDTTAIVNGSVNPEGAFTSYWYEYGPTSNTLVSKTSKQDLGSGFVLISAPDYISGLSKNSLYSFRLVGENKYGKVMGEIYSFKTTDGKQAPVGNSPTVKTITASNISRESVNLNGEVTPNKAETQYWFEYGKTAELGNTSTFSSAGDGNSKKNVSAPLSNLEPLTTYYFRLNAQNQFGTINGSVLNFKTLGPISSKTPSVTTGNASAISASGATFHGTVNPNSAETKYWFEYSTDSLLGQVLLKSTEAVSIGAGSSVMTIDRVITDLSSNTTYYFRIVAENSDGTSRGDKSTFKTE